MVPANRQPRRVILTRLLLAFGVIWALVSVGKELPFQVSYFNEWAGGRQGGEFHLRGSSFDWTHPQFRQQPAQPATEPPTRPR